MVNNKGKGKAKAKAINKSTSRKSKPQQFELVPENQREIVEWQGKEEIGTITNTLFSGPYAGWYKGEIEAYDSVFKTYKIKYQDNDIGNETAKQINADIEEGQLEILLRAPAALQALEDA